MCISHVDMTFIKIHYKLSFWKQNQSNIAIACCNSLVFCKAWYVDQVYDINTKRILCMKACKLHVGFYWREYYLPDKSLEIRTEKLSLLQKKLWSVYVSVM